MAVHVKTVFAVHDFLKKGNKKFGAAKRASWVSRIYFVHLT